MMIRSFGLLVVAVLVTSSTASTSAEQRQQSQQQQQQQQQDPQEHRQLQASTGINLCAAYDIVVPLIKDGVKNCACDGRTIKCDFNNVCTSNRSSNNNSGASSSSSSCADLDMEIDFSVEGQETITYTSTYANANLKPVEIVLNVAQDVSSIESCTATYGGETCECEVCGGNGDDNSNSSDSGINVDCGALAEGVTTGTCLPVDVGSFEAFIPFLEDQGKVIAGVQSEEAAATDSGAATATAASTTMIIGEIVAAVAVFMAL